MNSNSLKDAEANVETCDETTSLNTKKYLLTSKDKPEVQPSLKATLKFVAMCGGGLCADGYDLQVINLVTAILAHIYPTDMNASGKSFCASMTLAGVVLGQLSFGTLGDIVGRKRASMVTSALTIVGAGACACCVPSSSFPLATQLGLLRFLLGLGIGGEYPLSAAIGKEASKSGQLLVTPSQMLAINCLCFSFGVISMCGLVLILLACNVPMGATWRIALAFGMVPSLIALFMRMEMREPEATEAQSGSMLRTLQSRWWVLIGASLCWCLCNVQSFGIGSFSSIVCEDLLGKPSDDMRSAVKRDALFALVAGCLQAGGKTFGTVLLSHNRLNPKDLQMYGFLGMALMMLLLAGLYGVHSPAVLAALYFGWSTLTAACGLSNYIIPAESFPAVVRSTGHGIAAASGKMGAVVGTALFPLGEHYFGLRAVFFMCGAVNLLGLGSTLLFFPPWKGSSEHAT